VKINAINGIRELQTMGWVLEIPESNINAIFGLLT